MAKEHEVVSITDPVRARACEADEACLRVEEFAACEEGGEISQQTMEGAGIALLGASPGASTAAPIMLHLMEKVFKDKVASPEWQAKLKTIIPSYGTKLNGNVDATEQELEYTSRVLQLQYVKPQAADAAPKAELKPQAENKPVADIAL